MKTIHNLVYKRGYGKVDGRRTALNSNEIVEKVLRKCASHLLHSAHVYRQT
jgi:hypothetical protein